MPPRAPDLFRTMSAKFVFAFAAASAGAAQPTSDRVQELSEQNRQLQEQVRTQQKTIEEISARMAEILRSTERHERELRGLEERVDSPSGTAGSSAISRGSSHEAGARISAEAGFAYFQTGRNGQFPVGGFRVDDPTIGVEIPVAKNVYFYSELKLLPREANDERFQLGELYVDFEDVASRWGYPGLLNVRAGRLNIPFGEEYLARGPIANPLVSHSMSDIWGCDEGLEIYGRIGPAQYVVAVQNGGVSRLRDFHSAKSVAARVSWNPARWLHVSGSAMRTGKLATVADNLSELWFGNGFFRALGPAATTATFWADLFEADATARWKHGHVTAALGHVRFDDSDARADNSRRLRYGYLEAVQEIAAPLYVAARYSAIHVPSGYPLAGWGPLGTFFFRPGVLTEELRRTSVGIGYRFGPPLVLKVEYAWESGRLTSGVPRNHENFFGAELGVRF